MLILNKKELKRVRYRVSVKMKTGTNAGKYVVQCSDCSYSEALELYDTWQPLGYDVLIIERGVRKIDFKHLNKYRPNSRN